MPLKSRRTYNQIAHQHQLAVYLYPVCYDFHIPSEGQSIGHLIILDTPLCLENGLKRDIKKLTDYWPEYRLRIGNWRVLFEIEEDKIALQRDLLNFVLDFA